MKNVLICISLILIGIAVLLTSCQNAAITGAKSYMADRNYDKAIEECQLAITQDPSNAEAYYIMGQAYGRKRMYPEMLEAFNKCLEINQKFAADIDQHKTKYWVEIFNDGVVYDLWIRILIMNSSSTIGRIPGDNIVFNNGRGIVTIDTTAFGPNRIPLDYVVNDSCRRILAVNTVTIVRISKLIC